MPASLVLLSQTPLLFKHVYWLSTAARWMLAGLWPLNQHACCSCKMHACWPSVTVTNTATVQTCLLVENCCKMDACWTVATQSACLLSPNIAWLKALCFAICYTSWISCFCWYSVSLSASLLVWWIIIGHAFWFGTSLSAMPVGVVPHYRSCLLVWCLTVGHVFWCGVSL